MAAPTTAHDVLDADTLNADAYSGWRNLVRNPYLVGWVGDRPCYFGLHGGTPATPPAQDTTAAQGYRGAVALLWTAAGGDSASAAMQDVGGVVAPTRGGASLFAPWLGMTVVCRVKSSTASLVRARITHNSVDYTGDWHTGGGGWEDLAVTLPASVAYTSGQSVYVGVDVAGGTAGTFYLDSVQASLGEFQPGLLVSRPSILRAELGAAQASWSRRSEGALQLVAIRNLDGEVRAGGVYLDFAPGWLAICGTSTPNVVAVLHNPLRSGTNAWTANELRRIACVGYASGTITVAPLATTTFGTAGTNLRSDFLVAIEPSTFLGDTYPT